MTEGLDNLKGSRKAYRSHLTRIYGKLEDLDLTKPPNDDTTATVKSYIEQLQRKAESIQAIDGKIQSIMEDPSEIEGDVLDSLEIQDTLIEKITRLKHYLEKTKVTTVTPLPPTTTETTTRSATASRLPKLDLPKYSGDPLGWQTFWDCPIIYVDS